MSDLNTMFNNGMGSLASLTMGQDQVADREKQALAMQFERQKMEQAAQMHPLDMQQKRATLDQMAAQLPGIQGQSLSAGVKGQIDHASMGMKLAETLSKSANQLGKDGMDSLRREGEVLGQAAVVMSQVPPAMHKQVLQSFAKQYGTTNSPLLQAMLQAPDDELLPGITEVSKGLALTTSKYIQDSALKDQENKSQKEIADAANKTRLEQERIKAEARARAEKLRAEARQQGLSLDKQLAAFLKIPEVDRTPADWDSIQSIQQFMLKKAAVGANAVPASVLGEQTPIQRAEDAGKVNRPAQPTPTPPAGDLQSAVKTAGYPYEPNKYNYRIDPATGLAQRAPK